MALPPGRRRDSKSRRRSLQKCEKCCHVARNHFKLRRHVVCYHLVNKPQTSGKLHKVYSKLAVKRGKRPLGRWNLASVGAGNPGKSIKSSPSKEGCLIVPEDDNLKRLPRKTALVSPSVCVKNEKLERTYSTRSSRIRKVSQKTPDDVEVVQSCGRSSRSTRRSAGASKLQVEEDNSKSKTGRAKSSTDSSKSKTRSLKLRRGSEKKNKGKRLLQPCPCHLCDYVGRDSFNLKRHLQSKHEPKPPKQRTLYQCEQCEYKNKHRFLIKRHSAIHSREGGRRKEGASGFACDKCNYVGGSACNLKRHQVCRHEKVKEAKLQCSLCDHREPDRPALFGHFQETHGVVIETEKLEFDDFHSFMEFKTDTEKATFARFVRQQTRTGQKKHVIFKCHRDGIFKSKSRGEQRKRALKTTGSNKINSACPASMRMTIDTCGKVSVLFTKTHVGHSNEVCRLTLTKDEKILIAEMLESKRSFQEIISEIRNGMESERLERIHLLSRKDLQNIERWYRTRDVEEAPRISIDISIDEWVTKIQETEAVRLYKKPATILPKPFKCLEYDDFILILANDLQLTMLKNYGNECICIDNSYENSQLKLTTLMVLDDSRLGFPCAFMLSSKIDKIIMKVFLEVVRKASCCPLTPSIFISDIPDYRRTEWGAVMDLPESTEVLYSPWSIEEDLKRNLCKVKNEEERQRVYNAVQKLILEKTPSAISSLLEKTMKCFSENPLTELFGKYFKTKFADTSKKWAACFRNRFTADAKLGLESAHEILKFVYSEGQKNVKLEDCICVLMTCCRDQLQDRIVLPERISPHEGYEEAESEVGRVVDLIGKRHEDAVDMKSQTVDSGVYEIVENNVQCRCGLRCLKCDVCIHSYRCTCSDSVIGWTVCRHIHFCIMSNPVEQESILADHPFDPLEEKRKLLQEFENMCDDIAADGDSTDETAMVEIPIIEELTKEGHQQEHATVHEIELVHESERVLVHGPVTVQVHEPDHVVHGSDIRLEPKSETVQEPKRETEQSEQVLPLPSPPQCSSRPSPLGQLDDVKSKFQSRFQNICQQMSSDVDISLIEQALATIENAIASRQTR